MRAFLHAVLGQRHQFAAMSALASGMGKHGIEVSVDHDLRPPAGTDFIVWWGDKAPRGLADYPRLILENGFINGRSGNYVQDRLQFISTGWSGLHGRADSGPLDRPPDRWVQLDEPLLPWREEGETMLVCDQHPADVSAPPRGNRWWEGAVELSNDAWLRLVYRPHPLLAPDLKPLALSLVRAAVCVTWSSTCAIEAVIAGVPTIALDRGSMAWSVTSHGFDEKLFLGDRRQWAYNLAYRQWTHEELADGTAWENMRYGIESINSP